MDKPCDIPTPSISLAYLPDLVPSDPQASDTGPDVISALSLPSLARTTVSYPYAPGVIWEPLQPISSRGEDRGIWGGNQHLIPQISLSVSPMLMTKSLFSR